MSAGVAVYPDNATDLDALFVAADHSLYAFKRAGRRRTIVAGAV